MTCRLAGISHHAGGPTYRDALAQRLAAPPVADRGRSPRASGARGSPKCSQCCHQGAVGLASAWSRAVSSHGACPFAARCSPGNWTTHDGSPTAYGSWRRCRSASRNTVMVAIGVLIPVTATYAARAPPTSDRFERKTGVERRGTTWRTRSTSGGWLGCWSPSTGTALKRWHPAPRITVSARACTKAPRSGAGWLRRSPSRETRTRSGGRTDDKPHHRLVHSSFLSVRSSTA